MKRTVTSKLRPPGDPPGNPPGIGTCGRLEIACEIEVVHLISGAAVTLFWAFMEAAVKLAYHVLISINSSINSSLKPQVRQARCLSYVTPLIPPSRLFRGQVRGDLKFKENYRLVEKPPG